MSPGPEAADVVGVGAGPAGAATALLLARAGADVLLLDRRDFPRAKPCGDCLSAAAAAVLDRLGVLTTVEAARPARLAGWRIHAPSGHAFDGCFASSAADDARARTALSLPRERLDAVLLDAARRAGARVATGLHVVDALRGDDGAVRGVAALDRHGRRSDLGARLVIGADGLRSILTRRLGLVRRPPRLRKLSLTAHVRGVEDVGARGEMHVARHACAGLAPVEDGADPLCNLTLVVSADRFGRTLAGGPERFFRAALAWFPALERRLAGLELEGPLLASGPFDWPTRDVVAPGAALVGDAAGYFDPFTGQGIFQALASAELVADDALRALERGEASPLLRRYAAARRRLLRGARALQHGVDWALCAPARAEAVIARLARTPGTADALVAVTGDLLPVRSLLRPALILDFLRPIPAERRP